LVNIGHSDQQPELSVQKKSRTILIALLKLTNRDKNNGLIGGVEIFAINDQSYSILILITCLDWLTDFAIKNPNDQN
jgi:hypothetical protein